MDLSPEHYRAMIYYDFRRKYSAQECIKNLHIAFGDDAPHKTTVFRWYSEFNQGRAFLSNDFKKGRPKSAVVQENIVAVRQLLDRDPQLTYRQIKATLGISMSSIHTILHEHLGVQKDEKDRSSKVKAKRKSQTLQQKVKTKTKIRNHTERCE